MENKKKTKRTLLSSMEEIVNLAKKYSMEPEFYEQASASIKYASKGDGQQPKSRKPSTLHFTINAALPKAS